ncbi:hypothetical protein DPMN_049594 [Dreissena polymorpha]|uniref:Uncharacterized protein n=1 Tax=Dreissena polymorpha TaxID=45954 RepID=A0A9D4CG73_DREPO|nr:hypothetical protein DPMN_049594 [Dreissena polymorpha]
MDNGAKTYEANRTTAAEKRQARKARVASPTGDVPLLPFVQEYSVPGSASAAICAHTDKASPRPKDDLSGPSRDDGRTNEQSKLLTE